MVRVGGVEACGRGEETNGDEEAEPGCEFGAVGLVVEVIEVAEGCVEEGEAGAMWVCGVVVLVEARWQTWRSLEGWCVQC